jgi:hypothetical protein
MFRRKTTCRAGSGQDILCGAGRNSRRNVNWAPGASAPIPLIPRSATCFFSKDSIFSIEGQFNVNAGSTDQFSLNFTAGRLVEILISGDGDTDLDLYVYDSNNNLIASSEDYSDDCYVSWVPRWTGNFTIKVVNRGGVYNRYVILTN